MGTISHEIYLYETIRIPFRGEGLLLQMHFQYQQLLVIGYGCYGAVGAMKVFKKIFVKVCSFELNLRLYMV